MIKCDFCVTARYDDDGKVHSNENLCCTKNCADAIRIMSEVMKEEYRNHEK